MTTMIKSLIYDLKRPYHYIKTGLLRGFLAEMRYGKPSTQLHVSVITGTDGKTTSTTLLYHVLKTARFEVGLLSTVAAYLGEQEIDTGFHVTSPQPDQLQKFMRQMVDNGYTHLVLEVTSHGSYQYRTWGIQPQIAGLTNIAHEHLDYHVTYARYLSAKAAILKQAPTVVINEEDASYLKVRRHLGAEHTIIPYSKETKLPKKIRQVIENTFPEDYNQMNARLVYVMAHTMGVNDEDYTTALQTFPGIPGRMQEIPTRRHFSIVVDFAHTPQGLEAVLRNLRKRLIAQNKERGKQGRLIVVFGCAGQRDYAKRPVMGKIASTLADYCIFTAEDPRTENVWSIIRQMKEQLTEKHSAIISIADRFKAIEFALNTLAKPGDIIAVLGKGHEQSMCYGTTEYPWSDKQAIERILAETN